VRSSLLARPRKLTTLIKVCVQNSPLTPSDSHAPTTSLLGNYDKHKKKDPRGILLVSFTAKLKHRYLLTVLDRVRGLKTSSPNYGAGQELLAIPSCVCVVPTRGEEDRTTAVVAIKTGRKLQKTKPFVCA